ncbi:hypothetical protein [Brevundimonas naejangsanensis]|uniref:hypothetical protein n=1 Tax=Brevundimonas naejangsanensis TaxID=588932 RepID=UPI0032084309
MNADLRAHVFQCVDDMIAEFLVRVLDGGTMTREEQLATLRQLQQDRKKLRLAGQKPAGEA